MSKLLGEISVRVRGGRKKPLKMSGFAEKKIAVNSEENVLDDDEKIGAREVISGVSCYDSRDGSVFISSISIGGGNYRVKRHNNEIVFQPRVKGEEKASLKEKVRRNGL